MLLADRKTFLYNLYLESGEKLNLEKFAADFNQSLAKINTEFDSKIKSGRLKLVEVKELKAGTFDEYKLARIKAGQKESQFKTVCLQYADQETFSFNDYLV